MLSDTNSVNKQLKNTEWDISKAKNWENSFPSKTIFINKGKKTKHSLQIIASLALLGPNTTRELAKFTIKQSKNYPYSKPRNQDSRVLEQTFSRLIKGQQKRKTGKKKSSEKYPSLESNMYVRKIGEKINEKGKKVNLYSLTFTGFLFSLGFNFKNDDFKKLLHNASRHHLFFAYVQKIADCTSIHFIKKIFLNPISEIIEEDKIRLDEEISFYFSYMAESIGRSLGKSLYVFDSIDDDEDMEKLQFVKHIQKLTFYDDRPTSDWPHAMVDIFYPNNDDLDFFLEHAHLAMEENLLYKIMQKVHLVYFGYGGNYIPRRTQKIPSSKRWKRFQKYYPEYKNPRERDKKEKIMIRYDADYIPG